MKSKLTGYTKWDIRHRISFYIMDVWTTRILLKGKNNEK